MATSLKAYCHCWIDMSTRNRSKTDDCDTNSKAKCKRHCKRRPTKCDGTAPNTDHKCGTTKFGTHLFPHNKTAFSTPYWFIFRSIMTPPVRMMKKMTRSAACICPLIQFHTLLDRWLPCLGHRNTIHGTSVAFDMVTQNLHFLRPQSSHRDHRKAQQRA